MSIEAPISDIAPAASKGVDRRTVLKAGAWAAPVVLLTTAIPAAAASVTGSTLTAVRSNGDFFNLTLVLVGTATGAPLSTTVTGGGVTWVTSFPSSVTSPNTYTARVRAGGTKGQSSTILVTVGTVQASATIVK